VFSLISYLVRTFNIVPQESVIDQLLAIVGTNFAAAAAGVVIGSLTAPSRRQYIAIILACCSAAFAIAMVVAVFLYPSQLSQSLFHAGIGSAAWVVGAIVGAKVFIEALGEQRRVTN